MITPPQLAGLKLLASWLSFPAATTTITPRLAASSKAAWNAGVSLQGTAPPRLRLSTWAGLGLSGTGGKDTPTAQRIASTMSAVLPPPTPSTLRGRIRAFQSTPATPNPLFVAAPIVPATWLPW